MKCRKYHGCSAEVRKAVCSRYSAGCNQSYWKGEERNPFVAIFERPTNLEINTQRPVCCDTGERLVRILRMIRASKQFCDLYGVDSRKLFRSRIMIVNAIEHASEENIDENRVRHFVDLLCGKHVVLCFGEKADNLIHMAMMAHSEFSRQVKNGDVCIVSVYHPSGKNDTKVGCLVTKIAEYLINALVANKRNIHSFKEFSYWLRSNKRSKK